MEVEGIRSFGSLRTGLAHSRGSFIAGKQHLANSLTRAEQKNEAHSLDRLGRIRNGCHTATKCTKDAAWFYYTCSKNRLSPLHHLLFRVCNRPIQFRFCIMNFCADPSQIHCHDDFEWFPNREFMHAKTFSGVCDRLKDMQAWHSIVEPMKR